MRKISKILSAFLAVIMLLGCCVFTVSAEEIEADTVWYTAAAETKEAILTTPAQLKGLSTLVASGGAEANSLFAGWTIKLGADIVFNEGKNVPELAKTVNNGLTSWTPIKKFSGTFDGQGHVISGLYFNQDNATNIGLFGMTDEATIRNVSVVNSYFKGRAGIGAIVGSATGLPSTISNCYTDAYLVSYTQGVDKSCVGGILGVAGAQTTVDEEVTGCVVENCWFDGDIYCYDQTPNTNWTQNASRVGGIVGSSEFVVKDTLYYPMTIRNCLVTGDIEAHATMGGIAGSMRSTAAPNVIENCLMLGTMKATRAKDAIASGMFAETTSKNVTVTMTNVYGLDTFRLVHEPCKDNIDSGIKYYGWETNIFGNDGDTGLNVTLTNGGTTKTYPKALDTTADPAPTDQEKADLDAFNNLGKVTAASITGDTAKTTLSGFDFDGEDAIWATVAGGTPVLKELAYEAENKAFAPDTVKFQTKGTRSSYDARFIAIVDDYTKYDEIGITVKIGSKEQHFNCWNVYDSILAGQYDEPYTASSMGGKYIVAVVLEGMSGEKTVTVTPWVKYKGETQKTVGLSDTFTIGANNFQ